MISRLSRFCVLIIGLVSAMPTAHAWFGYGTTIHFGYGRVGVSSYYRYGYGLGYGFGRFGWFGYGRTGYRLPRYAGFSASQYKRAQQIAEALAEKKRQIYFAQNIPAQDQQRILEKNGVPAPQQAPSAPEPEIRIEKKPTDSETAPISTVTAADGQSVITYY